MKDEKQKCSICGDEHNADILMEFDGELLCPNCLNNETVICSHCHKRIWVDYNSGSNTRVLT